ncbi:hypothetical protein CSUI_008878 [Cystoisospora suis]|uniref:Uncharacterized protein n=1 Tax=Cystoisospora suis TaxID=483139 RepID=A0A2C6KLP6_9APIC|nr:hypothetical protein CSUI_008878 [Cystoisospora suis]
MRPEVASAPEVLFFPVRLCSWGLGKSLLFPWGLESPFLSPYKATEKMEGILMRPKERPRYSFPPPIKEKKEPSERNC